MAGRFVDRWGATAMSVVTAGTLLAAGVVAALAPNHSFTLIALALALLGLGWSFGLVTGTAIVTNSTALATRAKVQGLVDVAIAGAGAVGGLASGMVVAFAGYPILAILCGVLAFVAAPAAIVAARRGSARA
ncbi:MULTISPECIES: MFS transporter [Streptomyces]|uniref:MFS transporter n=1 Tax=Streptomyces TaxID=1883 RepID=UPI0029BFE39A|nr:MULTISPECIES: MFS transporter [unclassified Streptomyces]